MNVAVEVRGLRKAFGEKRVLRGIDLAVGRGEVFAIVGPSGSGKTTLLRILAGLERRDGGTAIIEGHTLPRNGGVTPDQVGFVMQKPAALRRTVFENVAFGLRLRRVPEAELERRVSAALAEVGLLDARGEKAWTLSAGEAQRMCFARSAVMQPRILLLDEFTAHLDPANVAALERAIRLYHEEHGATILIVTHNLFQPKRVATRAGLLLGGQIVETADVDAFFANPTDPRTRAFVDGEMPY